MAETQILLKGGIIIQHGDLDTINILRDTDLLIVGQHIKQIGRAIISDKHALIIDCKDKIISPGFIDAHHHLWETQLKGRHGNDTLVDYFVSGVYNIEFHRPRAESTLN